MRALKSTDRILVPHGVIAKLCRDCGVSPNTVKEALHGMRQTETQELIRKRAVEFYGGKW